MPRVTGEFRVTQWDEQPFIDRPAGTLTRANVAQEVAGGIEGTGRVQWLMCYRDDGTADFVGLQDIEGTIDGRAGGFVVSSNGRFDGKQARGRWSVVAGSGRGELVGITGTGSFTAPHGSQATYRLTYQLG